jgi:PAS domain S-box-containing protein
VPERDDDRRLQSVTVHDVQSILLARQRADEELLRMREALCQSQERLTAALMAAGSGAFRWNIPENIVEWDGNLGHLFGLDPSLTSCSIGRLLAAVHPDDRAAVSERLGRCAADGSDFDMEFRVVWTDGSVHWLSDKARARFDRDGNPLYMTGACADITSRKAAAEALRESEERLRAIFDHAAVGIALCSLDGTFVEMNAKFCEILGYTTEELCTKTFRSITHPDDLGDTLASSAQLLAGEIPDYSLEKRYVRSDGSAVWCQATVTMLRDAAGRPERFIGVVQNITARKRAEAALRDETRILELLNETGRRLASTLDLQALVETMTDAATALSGAKYGAFLRNRKRPGRDRYELMVLTGATREAFEPLGRPGATALFGPTFRGEGPIRCDDVTQDPRYGRSGPPFGMPKGRLPVRSYLAMPVLSRSGEVIGGLFLGHPEAHVFTERSERLVVNVAAQAGVAIDNARLYEASQQAAEERKMLLDSERAARSEAERMSELKDGFLATLSHELRTPLNAIVGWAHVLRNGGKSETDLLKGLQTIERNARAQTQLIEDLLDMSRITSGKLRLDMQPIQPVAFIEAALETVRTAADAKGIRLERFLDSAAGPIYGDPGRLQQVIWNLLSNAIKFTPKSGKVQVVLERVNSHIEISVADTGCGIKPEFVPFLFERFRQADSATTRQYGGLGLGLSIVKSLVELHGGSVHATSPGVDQGTTVTVILPLTAVHRVEGGERLHPRSPQVTPPTFMPSELSGLKVLVVDDHADARDLVKRVLEDCGAEVLTAAGATEALGLIEQDKPDVLVSDIGMPDIDGYELLRRVRALGPAHGGRIPAVALTAFARSEDRTRALRAGFLVHVSKPVDPSELVATVASVSGRVDDSQA